MANPIIPPTPEQIAAQNAEAEQYKTYQIQGFEPEGVAPGTENLPPGPDIVPPQPQPFISPSVAAPIAATMQEQAPQIENDILQNYLQEVKPNEPWGYAKVDEKTGKFLFASKKDGERRWIDPDEVEEAAKMGMVPISETDNLRIDRYESRKGLTGSVKAALTSAADVLSFGAYRWAQRHRGYSYEDIEAGKEKPWYAIGDVSETPEEQKQLIAEHPIASLAGTAGGLALGLARGGMAYGTTRAVGPLGIIGTQAARLGAAGSKISKVAEITAEGAAIGLGGAASEIGMASPAEYEKMTPGSIAATLAKDAVVGAAVNGVFSLAGFGLGYTLSQGQKFILKRAGTNERNLEFAMNNELNSLKDINSVENLVKNSKDKDIVSRWEKLKSYIKSGEWEQANKKFSSPEEVERILKTQQEEMAKLGNPNRENIEKDIIQYQKSIENNKNLIEEIRSSLTMDYESKIIETDAAQTAIKQLEQKLIDLPKAAELYKKIDKTQKMNDIIQLDKDISTKIFPFEAGKTYSEYILNVNNMKKITNDIGKAIPGAHLLGSQLASIGIAGLAAGGLTYIAGGSLVNSLIAAAAPFIVRKMLVNNIKYITPMGKTLSEHGFTSTERKIYIKAKDIGQSAWEIIKPTAMREAVEIMPIYTEDDKAKVLEQAKILSTSEQRAALIKGLVDSGMELQSAIDISNMRKSAADLLLENKFLNKIEFSKLSHAVRSPLGAIGRFTQNIANRQDKIMLNRLYPDFIKNTKLTAEDMINRTTPSQLASQQGQLLRKLTGDITVGKTIMPSMRMQQPRSSSVTGVNKIGTRGFSGSATGLQSLEKYKTPKIK